MGSPADGPVTDPRRSSVSLGRAGAEDLDDCPVAPAPEPGRCSGARGGGGGGGPKSDCVPRAGEGEKRECRARGPPLTQSAGPAPRHT